MKTRWFIITLKDGAYFSSRRDKRMERKAAYLRRYRRGKKARR